MKITRQIVALKSATTFTANSVKQSWWIGPSAR